MKIRPFIVLRSITWGLADISAEESLPKECGPQEEGRQPSNVPLSNIPHISVTLLYMSVLACIKLLPGKESVPDLCV